jgi:hypothetical protein
MMATLLTVQPEALRVWTKLKYLEQLGDLSRSFSKDPVSSPPNYSIANSNYSPKGSSSAGICSEWDKYTYRQERQRGNDESAFLENPKQCSCRLSS